MVNVFQYGTYICNIMQHMVQHGPHTKKYYAVVHTQDQGAGHTQAPMRVGGERNARHTLYIYLGIKLFRKLRLYNGIGR